MSQIWLVTIPNNKEAPSGVFSAVAGQIDLKGAGRINRFTIPSMTVGTLDSLMALSDDLTKIGNQVENVVRKIERQYAELSTEKVEPLRVNEVPVEGFLKKFEWDMAQYPHQGKQLSELVAQIQAMAGKNEEELKMLSTSYTEKNLALAAAKRRQVLNLATSDFEDFLTPEKLAKIEVTNTEHLLTLMVVVPKANEQEFLNTYHTIGSDIAAFGGPDWTNSASIGTDDGKFGKGVKRTAVQGSPVVPGSKKKVAEEGESVMYAITVLRGHYQAGYYQDDVFVAGTFVDYLDKVKAAFREKRYVVREFSFDSNKTGGMKQELTVATKEVQQAKSTLLRWCKPHFSEAFSGWIHLKVIQAFVESVLRYGLPVDFTSMFFEIEGKIEKDLRTQLTRSILHYRPELRPKKTLVEEEEGENADTDSLPFVCLRFPLIGVSSTHA